MIEDNEQGAGELPQDATLPCPFCAALPLLQEHEPHRHGLSFGGFVMPDHPGSFTLECPTEGCCAMIADTKAEVVAAWNRRAQHAATVPQDIGRDAALAEPVAKIVEWLIAQGHMDWRSDGVDESGHEDGFNSNEEEAATLRYYVKKAALAALAATPPANVAQAAPKEQL